MNAQQPVQVGADVVGGALGGLVVCVRWLFFAAAVFLVVGTLYFAAHSHRSDRDSGREATMPAATTPVQMPSMPSQCWMFCDADAGVTR